MGFAFRRFLLDREDALYRLPNTTFERMLQNPTGHALPRFAGQRVRMADVAVELMDRQPVRVVRTTFSILTFNSEGFLDPAAFEQHQRARAELALAPALGPPARHATIVAATPRFVDQGGRWVPSTDVVNLLKRAAMERMKCLRL
jgi:hypothetical protein